MTASWEKYETVATELLRRFKDELGFSEVDGKCMLKGGGTEWEIDIKARDQDGGCVLIECKKWKSRAHQEIVAGLYARITFIGAKSGIIISPKPLQKGAKNLANQNSIDHILLNADANLYEYVLNYVNKNFIGVGLKNEVVLSDNLSIELKDKNENIKTK